MRRDYIKGKLTYRELEDGFVIVTANNRRCSVRDGDEFELKTGNGWEKVKVREGYIDLDGEYLNVSVVMGMEARVEVEVIPAYADEELLSTIHCEV